MRVWLCCWQDGATGAAVDVRAAMYALADRYFLLSPEEFAATNTLPALGEHILPTLMATEANSVRAALSFVLHAIAPVSPKGQQVPTSTLPIKSSCLTLE